MEKQFFGLTTKGNKPAIINKANIAYITLDNNNKVNIFFNCAEDKSQCLLIVEESLEIVKSRLI